MTEKLRCGFIGLGLMGLPMARRLLGAGHLLTVWNRSAGKAETLAGEGAVVAASPAEVYERSHLIGMCLTDGRAAEAVVSGDNGFLAATGDLSGRTVVDFSTITPATAVTIAGRLKAVGAGYVDAPVSGGVPAAEAGGLIVMAGGEVDDLAKAEPLFAAVSRRVSHMGGSGAGQTTKLCNQMIVSTNVLAMAEAYAFARRSGIDVGRLAQALEGGFADSKPLQIFGPRMASYAFEPKLGAIATMLKDLDLIRAAAADAGAISPLTALAAELYRSVRAHDGMSLDDDLGSIVRLFEDAR